MTSKIEQKSTYQEIFKIRRKHLLPVYGLFKYCLDAKANLFDELDSIEKLKTSVNLGILGLYHIALIKGTPFLIIKGLEQIIN